MDYVSHYTDLVYFASGGISVCRYRMLALASEPKQLVIQVENHCGHKGILIADHIVRDGVLNRIADRDLTGVPFAMLCVALTEAGQHHIVFVEADLEDYIHRGYPYERSAQPASRGRHIERISLNSRDLVVGRARLQTAHATPTLAADSLAAILDRPTSA
ncbi:hypothetical protein PFF91_28710 [Burkholderia cenocepacia]|uniref:hypothetical protein n=1 Tax=Burkholderia cenocepacia TaxID=95486 RepID=UPI0022EADF08|nr:hypothetical protein [Burkholderia cenocepacia]MDA3669983.1 hypothetical protein [Burkholderia cenocepacia]MDA3679763.1 hypothetical protein [Burkholderia cenocepacia]MDA3687600.1 hypothetical protein [Burkholderia cenocepacia]MDA3694997.1 hypothetical protein [Burkholderia cenocepacia]MDA3701948.1 hypothetical protein [Burkholderia cenocepacia]